MKLEVRYRDAVVGVLNDDIGQMLFQYDDRFLRLGTELSPFYLPLQSGVIELKGPFEGGLPGLFADSLPDYWGRAIMDRRLREAGIDPARVSVLKRLALVGDGGLGALGYHPAESEDAYEIGSLKAAVDFSRQVLEIAGEKLPGSKIIQQAGSNPGGRYPKLCVGWNPAEKRLAIGSQSLPEEFIPCLLKLDLGEAMPQGKAEVCRQEAALLDQARAAGIRTPRHWLLEGKDDEGHSYAHLLIERFDRREGTRIHMHSFSGVAHKLPVRYGASYEELLRVVSALTRDHREVEGMFRRMVFNILCGNRDDHVRNHAFLMEAPNQWQLSPAYDLTPTPELKEHALGVNGKWSGIAKSDLAQVGKLFSIKNADEIIDQCASVC
ncbi:MAG: type II toxin-antitoxin system HipA family toxin [Kiritimatiellales bacterium]|nr:type II toxin-antitoxin system HipA family toxin [Kiritimatiellales bacterium]